MPTNDLRLLALDGGGVRGLSSLMILEQLMEAVNPDAPPKPCDHFDMIGGTSTGGLIAVMLGRLRMSVADCITAYLSLSERVFRKIRHRVTIKGKLQGRFDSEELAQAVREVIKQQGLQEDALRKDDPEANCKVKVQADYRRFVCAMSKETCETVCLTSYRSPKGGSDLLNSVKIWEACRATSAASSFFDPIAVGRYKEEFIDGATGANNPVREVWDQAQTVWGGSEPLEGRVKCLISIGTGVPSLKPFQDDALHIGKALIAIATETEQTAERFQRERPLLDNTGGYYRFNVLHGLEDIDLEEEKKAKEIAAATRRYIRIQSKQIQTCADSIAGREYVGKYQTVFSMAGLPRVRQFIGRRAEMEQLKQDLLPRPGANCRQKIHVLHGLGGIGKTQLAVEFAWRYHRQFSSVFWLDGRSKDSIEQSIASCVSNIPPSQIPEVSRENITKGDVDVDVVIKDVMDWLARPDNTAWLLIIDNVDRGYSTQTTDPDAYDIKNYLSGANHGSILITTRLAKLQQLGEEQHVRKVGADQAKAIFESWYRRKHNKPDVETETKTERLLELLDGLPLAIAQAGAYLQESGVGVSTYLRCYEEQWSNLMELKNETNPPLLDYPNRSVWTTWAISYEAVRRKDESTANLLILWSFLDNRDLWYRLFAAACQGSPVVAGMLFKWIGDIARSKLHFSKAMQLLRSFSLIEEVEDQGSHATHPVVHQWAYHCQDKNFSSELGRLAIATVGWAIPGDWSRNYSSLQGRLLPHAQAKAIRHQISWALRSSGDAKVDLNGDEETKVLLAAIRRFSIFYSDQGKRGEAEELSKLVLLKREEVLGPNHTLTLQMVNNLGNVQADQGKLSEAEQNYKRALRGFRALDPNHEWLLYTSNNLAVLYVYQGKLSVAEQLFEQALCGSEEANGLNHTITLQIVSNLGAHYANQGKLVAAKQMHERALRGLEEALGPSHRLTINTVGNLGVLYFNQGKLSQSEQMCKRALRGCEEALGPEDRLTLGIINNLGFIYAKQSKMSQLEKMYERALRGYEETLGGERIKTYRPALRTLVRMGSLYEKQEAFTKARSAYLRALPGYETLLGPSDRNCQQLRSMIAALRSPDEGLQYVPGLNVELLEMEDRKDNKRRKMS